MTDFMTARRIRMEIPIENVYAQIRDFAEKFDVEKIVLFGSRARKTNHLKSDIDIAVYGCKKFELFSDALNEDLWSLLQLDIINMDKDNVSPDLISEIERDGVVLYEKI